MLKDIKLKLGKKEDKLAQKISEIENSKALMKNAQKETEDAKKTHDSITRQIRAMEKQASHWQTDTKVMKRLNSFRKQLILLKRRS